jgi:hypothetical protein
LEDRELVSRVGFWSAVLTTAAIVLWVLITAINAFVPLHFWVNFSALLIAPAFLVLMASLHTYMPPRRKLWSLIALVFSIIYAVIIAQNYFLQMTVVRQNPLAFDLLTMDPSRNDSVFWALEILGYGFMSFAALFISPAFQKVGIENWIRWLFIANGIFAMIAAVGFVLTANPLHIVSLMSVGVWSITFPIATTLLAIVFKRAKRGE